MKRRHVFNGDMREIHLTLTPLEEARLKSLMFEVMSPEFPPDNRGEHEKDVKLLAEMTGSEEEYEEWMNQPLPF